MSSLIKTTGSCAWEIGKAFAKQLMGMAPSITDNNPWIVPTLGTSALFGGD